MDKANVIMSVYKGDSPISLKQALESMVNQTYGNLGIYICQDGFVSNDLKNVINNYLEKYSNIHLIENSTNRGLAKSINRLIDLLLKDDNNKYFVRMDADDISLKERVSIQINYMKENQINVCGSYCKEFGASYALSEKKVPITHQEILLKSVTNCPFIHPTVVFDRTVFESGIRYPEDTVFTEDMALWFILIEARYKLGNIPEVLLEYRLTEDTVERRLGWHKGYNEFQLRMRYMISNRTFSLINFIKIFARLPFHILPISLAKLLYRYAR
ncbi:glycosyltransferase [Vibrio breoganii]